MIPKLFRNYGIALTVKASSQTTCYPEQQDTDTRRFFMKNIKNVFGIIVALAIIVSFTACEDEDPGSDPSLNSPPGALGAALTITNEQVYTMEFGEDGIEYPEYTKPAGVTFTSNVGGTVTVTEAGKLSCSVGVPDSSLLSALFNSENEEESIVSFEFWNNIVYTQPNARGIPLEITSSATDSLAKAIFSVSETGLIIKSVGFIYVDRDLTITGQGKSGTITVMEGEANYTTENLNLVLKTGWNAIYNEIKIIEETATIKFVSDNPSVKWVLTEVPDLEALD